MADSGTGATSRRYDVDWLRTIALVLLIVYHAMLSFQEQTDWALFPQGPLLGWLAFITQWLSIFRIPLLFVISGMGTAFALRRRSVGELVKDRTRRFLEPLLLGSLMVVPLGGLFLQLYNGTPREDINYQPGAAHLWFLQILPLFVLLTLPLIAAVKKYPDGRLLQLLGRGLRVPCMGLVMFSVPFALESWLMDPQPFNFWPPRIVAGWICFGFGFLMTSVGQDFWDAVERDRWLCGAVGLALYLTRLFVYGFQDVPGPLLAVEAASWILTCLGFAAVHLNRPSPRLRYLNGAVYPMYIVHMPIQFMLSIFILRLDAPPLILLQLLIVGVLGLSWAMYHYVLRPMWWLHWSFGISEPRPAP